MLMTQRGVLASCGVLLRLEEEYWFRVVFTTRRGVLISCGFLRLIEYWFRVVFCSFYFSSF